MSGKNDSYSSLWNNFYLVIYETQEKNPIYKA